jgi:O-antigen/teichoic acid export membrane protein
MTTAGEATAPSTITRAIGALAGGEVLARAAAFLATALLARRLGPEGFGVIGFAMAVCGYLSLGVNGGLGDVGTREVARAPGQAGHLYSSVATIRMVLAAAAMLVLGLIALLLPVPPVTRLVVFLSGLTIFSVALDPTWVFRALERPVVAGAGLVLGQVVYAVAVLVLIHEPADVTRVPILQFGGELVAALALVVVLFRRARPRFALLEGWRLLRRTGYLSLARMLRTLVISADVIMLAFLTTEREVGLYTAAYRITFLLMAVAGSVSAAYMPSYARVVQGGPAGLKRLIDSSLGLALLIGAPLVAGVMATAGPLILLLFGAEYADATLSTQLLALSVGIMFVYWCVSVLLIVAHRSREYAAIHGTSAAANILLNLVLIPRFGIEGAAAATLASEVIVVVAGVVILARMDALPSARTVLAPVAAAAGMAAVIVIIGGAWPVAANVVLGAVVYATLAWLFGATSLYSSVSSIDRS